MFGEPTAESPEPRMILWKKHDRAGSLCLRPLFGFDCPIDVGPTNDTEWFRWPPFRQPWYPPRWGGGGGGGGGICIWFIYSLVWTSPIIVGLYDGLV